MARPGRWSCRPISITMSPFSPGTPDAPRRFLSRGAVAQWTCRLLLPLLLWWVQWGMRPLEPTITHDAGLYLDGASSLRSAHGYRAPSYLGEPCIGLYPPGQSILLAAFAGNTAEPGPFIARGQQVMMAICLLTLLVLGHWGWKIAPGRPACALPVLLVGLHSIWSVAIWGVLSDVTFTCLVVALLSVWLPEGIGTERGRWFGTAILLAAAYLVRTAALPFVGMALLVAAWRFRKGDRMPLPAVAVLALAAWLWVRLSHGDGAGYGENYRADWGAVGGATGYLRLLGAKLAVFGRGDLFWSVMFPAAKRLGNVVGQRWPSMLTGFGILRAAVATGVVVLAGTGIRSAPRREWPIVVAATLYGVLLMLLPTAYDVGMTERYHLVLIPPALWWTLRGMDAWIARWRPPVWTVRACEALLVVAVASGGLWDLAWAKRIERSEVARGGSLERSRLVAAIRRHVGDGEVVAASRGVAVYQLSRLLGKQFATDYFVPREVQSSPIYVRHDQQRFVAANWLVGNFYDDFGSKEPGKRPGLPGGLLKVVFLDPESYMYLARVDPTLDREWRAAGY